MKSLNLKFNSGSSTSETKYAQADEYIASMFVPSELAGDTLEIFGDIGDGVLRQMNFSFDLTSASPNTVYRGQAVAGLQVNFSGIKQIYCSTGSTPQTQDVEVVFGYL